MRACERGCSQDSAGREIGRWFVSSRSRTLISARASVISSRTGRRCAPGSRHKGRDLIIHGGDVTVDGADDEDDFRFCAELVRDPPRAGVRRAGQPRRRRAAASTSAGEFRSARRAGVAISAPITGPATSKEWRLIGLNSQLLGSGEAEEKRQLALA